MENRESREKKAFTRTVPPYARLFFDHLYSEYVTVRPAITDPDIVKRLDDLNEQRLKHELTWSDIYTFDLTLVDWRPPESLVRKAYDSHARYRSVAGQKEYDEYIASKPLDLGSIQIDPDAQPPKPNVLIERELRADIKYLLSRFYLYYALFPMREGLRDQLTKRAVIVTGFVVLLIALAIAINIGGSWLILGFDQYAAVVVTVLTVVLAGVIGGCVSMLQRIQAAPSEGDALFNLAALTNGWRGILLSPVYGGIFASLLFVLFAGNVLNGAVFPSIVTPMRGNTLALTTAPQASPSPATANVAKSPVASPTSSAATPEASASPAATMSPAPKATPSPAGSPLLRVSTTIGETPATGSPTPPTSRVLQIKDFLKETGPASGVAYALLIIWSFLAGFAERLVPDTLNRLVQKNIDLQGGKG